VRRYWLLSQYISDIYGPQKFISCHLKLTAIREYLVTVYNLANSLIKRKCTECELEYTVCVWRDFTCFGQFLCPSSGVFHCRHSSGVLRSILILLASCQQTCMTYTIAVCTVKNSWWWAEELSETCRFSLQNKFEKLVHLVDFIIRVTVVHFAFAGNEKNMSSIIYHGQSRLEQTASSSWMFILNIAGSNLSKNFTKSYT
jgi:hypothetical protein